MCRVMASNSRAPSVLRNGPVRRNLFGPVDREQLRRDYHAALRKDLEEASRRWDFDFVKDRPLENGRFQWEGVSGAEMPLLYRSCVAEAGAAGAGSVAEAAEAEWADAVQSENESEKENDVPGSPRRHAFHLLKAEKTPEKDERRRLKRKQTNITDFYEAKRRVVWMPRKSGE